MTDTETLAAEPEVTPRGPEDPARWPTPSPGVSDTHPTYDPPTLTSIAPTTAALGAPNFTLTATGTNFHRDAIIFWNGAPEPTTWVSATQVTTLVNMATAQVAMPIPVAVANGLSGILSAPKTFTLTAT